MEQRLAGLTPEQVLRKYPPEERLAEEADRVMGKTGTATTRSAEQTRSLVTLALVSMLAACDGRSSTSAAEPGVAATSSIGVVPLPSIPPADGPPTKRVAPDDRAGAFDQVKRALAALRTDKRAARDQLGTLTSFCVGEAGLAYLSWDAHQADAAAAHLARVKGLPGMAACVALDEKPLGEQVLSALRHGLDDLRHPDDGDRVALPCEIFEEHPAEAFAASSPFWGSTRDLPALDDQRRCAESMVTTALPASEAPRTLSALKNAMMASFRVVHVPSGTRWISTSNAIGTGIARALIAPELIHPDPELRARLARIVAKTKPHVRDMQKRLAAFNEMRATESPVLARAICAVAARRAGALPPARCRELAEHVVDATLMEWLETAPWEASYLEGAP